MALLLMTRLLAASVAVVLLAVHRVTAHDPVLIVATVAFTAASLVAFRSAPRLQLAPVAWLVDALAVLALVAASEDWRSPFYVLMLTALILPATGLPFRRALVWGVAFTLAYLGVAVYTELDANTLESTIRLETIATHLMVPLVVVLALAYAAEVLEPLRAERTRGERFAVERERQRIAWELHDSASSACTQRISSSAICTAASRSPGRARRPRPRRTARRGRRHGHERRRAAHAARGPRGRAPARRTRHRACAGEQSPRRSPASTGS